MGIGVSIFLIALGAILAFAVHVTPSGIDLQAVGVILMIVGLLGGLLSAAFWSSWGGFPRRTATTVVDPAVRPVVDAAGRPVVDTLGRRVVDSGVPRGTVVTRTPATTVPGEPPVPPPAEPYV